MNTYILYKDRTSKLILIHTGLQNPYGYGNSHIFRNQEMKPSQKCTTITWFSTIFEVSSQYKLFNIIKCNKRYNKNIIR
jgi:hypothetical protein